MPLNVPALAVGKRYTLPRPHGSADSMLLARHAQQLKVHRQCLVVFTAEPPDAQRLQEETRLFAPELQTALFPDWENLP